jgi:tetratricopeptide (TPR) repeat protein
MSEDRFRWEFDPNQVQPSLEALRDRIRSLVDQGRYTKVRIKYKGKPLIADLPMATLLAAETLTLPLTGPIWLLIANLGVKAFLEVEFVHEADERVREGQELFNDGEVDGAEAKYREAIRMKPDHPVAHYHLGVLLRVTGRREEAIAAFELAAVGDHEEARKAAEALDRMRRGGKTL